MKKFTKVTSKYYFFDLFENKAPKCPLLIPDTVLMKDSTIPFACINPKLENPINWFFNTK